MSGQAEVALSYDNGQWRARGDRLELEHRELRELDALIERTFAQRANTTHVYVRFDLSTLPVWLRQYQAHYCNYVLHVIPQGKRA